MGEWPRKVETYSRKLKNQSYNSFWGWNLFNNTQFVHHPRVLEETKKGLKEIQLLLGNFTQNVNQLSEPMTIVQISKKK